MNRRIPAVLILIVCVFTLKSVSGGPGDAKRESKPQPFVDEALRWLPVDVETVIVSQGSFEIPFEQEGPGPTFQGLPFGLLGTIREGKLVAQLKQKKVNFAVEGSRRFRSPKGLGLMPFEGCQIVQFERGTSDSVKAAFRWCMENADAKKLLAGQKVAIFRERLDKDDWTLLVAHPQSRILLFATDLAFLEELLKRMDGEPRGRALPEDLSEWDHVNVNAPVWAVRHYRQEAAADDPSSPLGPAAAANRPDPGATGFVFWYDPKSPGPLTARYISKGPNAEQLIKEVWRQPAEGLIPQIEYVAPGVAEISAKAGAKDGWEMFLFVLLGYLGHGVYV
jgi:hypothetical protein